MPRKDPLLLYSANCSLAYRIAEEYYENIHYVWCSKSFGSPGVDNLMFKNPRSSMPYERFMELKQDTAVVPDGHSSMIASQRAGIKRGATLNHRAGKITKNERNEILAAVDGAAVQDFAPLIYVMPYEKVKKLAKRVPVKSRAHPLSDEWVIDGLPRDYFDIIRF